MSAYAYTDEPCPTCGYALLETGRCTGSIRATPPAGAKLAPRAGDRLDVWVECPNSLAALLRDPVPLGSVGSPPSGATVAGRPPALSPRERP